MRIRQCLRKLRQDPTLEWGHSAMLLLVLPVSIIRPWLSGDSPTYVGRTLSLLFSGTLVPAAGELGSLGQHPYGTSLFFSLVAFPFSLIDRVAGHAVVQSSLAFYGSWSYVGITAASAVAAVISIRVGSWSLRRLGVNPGPGFAWLATGTGVTGFWAFSTPWYSHTVEFMSILLAIAATLRLIDVAHGGDSARLDSGSRVAGDVSTWRSAGLLGLALAFVLMVRPQNLGVLAVPIIVWMIAGASVNSPAHQRGSSLALRIAPPLLLGLAPLFALNRVVYGRAYPSISSQYGISFFVAPQRSQSVDSLGDAEAHESGTSALGEIFDLVRWATSQLSRMPEFLEWVLLSQSFGVLIWTPIYLLGVLAVIIANKKVGQKLIRQIIVVALIVGHAAVPFGIVLLWRTTASSWGFRYLLPIAPLAIVGYLWSRRLLSPRVVRTADIWLGISVAISTISQVFWGTPSFERHGRIINAMGKADYTVPNMLFRVFEATFSVTEWVLVFASHVPGLILGITTRGQIPQWLFSAVAGGVQSRYDFGEASSWFASLSVSKSLVLLLILGGAAFLIPRAHRFGVSGHHCEH